MLCENCGKNIDGDSTFCVYCGNEINADQTNDAKENVQITDIQTLDSAQKDDIEDKEEYQEEFINRDLLDKKEKELHEKEKEIKKLHEYKDNLRIARNISITFLLIFAAVIAILGGSLASRTDAYNQANSNVAALQRDNRDLEREIDKLETHNRELSDSLKRAEIDYANLKSIQYFPPADENGEEVAVTTAKDQFLNNVYTLLGEYNSAFNHMDVHRSGEWYFNDPNQIAFEETFLVKLQELSNKLKNFSYPSSFVSQRNQLVEISESICHQGKIVIDCMKSNDFEGYLHYLNEFNHEVNRLFNYYNSLI